MRFLMNFLLLVLLAVVLAAWVMLPWPGAIVLALLIAAWLVLTRRGRQAASVASVGISTLTQRLGSSAVIVVGIAGVVGVLVALLAMAEGYSETLKQDRRRRHRDRHARRLGLRGDVGARRATASS